jgi:two-component system sensor histidine kinase KdpD
MARELATARTRDALATVAGRHLHDIFDTQVSLLVPGGDGKLRGALAAYAFTLDAKDEAAVAWVWKNDRAAGQSTDTLPAARALFLPVRGARGKLGVLAIAAAESRRFFDPDQRQLLDTFAAQLGGALERVLLEEEAQRALLDMETERMQSSILSSVSHDLRTPLAVVTGAASTLLEDDTKLTPAARRDLLETIHEESARLARLVHNLLDMTRLTAGALRVRKEWQPLEEVVGVALGRVQDRLGTRDVKVDLPQDLPLVAFDATLVEQVLVNLLENVARHTPPASPVELRARVQDGSALVELRDRGPGIPPGELERVFEKFYRVGREGGGAGAGLGLAICRGVVEAHGGRIWVENREGGGASFRFTLPMEGIAPSLGPDGGEA